MPSKDEIPIILDQEERADIRARFPGQSISNAARVALGFAALKRGGRRRRRIVEPIRDKQNNNAANQENEMIVIARNSFHGKEAKLRVPNQKITAARARQLRHEVCAKDCKCFADKTEFFEYQAGYRDSQRREIKLSAREAEDGGIILEA